MENDKNSQVDRQNLDAHKKFIEDKKMLLFIWAICVFTAVFQLWTGLLPDLTGFWLLKWWYAFWVLVLLIVTPGIIKGVPWSIHLLLPITLVIYLIHVGVYSLHYPLLIALIMNGPYLFLPLTAALFFEYVRKKAYQSSTPNE